MKKKIIFLFAIMGILIIFTFVSCDTNGPITYPTWFNEYSGGTLTDLKTAQDAYECFGSTIGSNVIIYGLNDSPSSPDIDYQEDSTGKYFMVTFGTRDNNDFVESTDIQPFKDAVLASGYVHDSAASSAGNDSYDKGNVTIQIYVIAMGGGDPHFEFVVEEIY